MSSYKVERARKVFQNMGAPSSVATRLAHVAEQAWSLCIRMDTGNLEDPVMNMCLRELAAIYGASNDGSAFDFRTADENIADKPPVPDDVVSYIKQQGWRE